MKRIYMKTEFYEPFHIEKSETYLDFIQLNPQTQNFSNLLIEFLIEYLNDSIFKPIECKLLMFNFPGEDYSEPMIKFIFPDVDEFDNLKIKDDIEKKFKIFLVNNSNDFKEFQIFRQIQQNFRFIIRRE